MEPYSNRELDHVFADIKATLERIEAQTIRTNGRVSVLERWRSYLAGGIAVIIGFAPVFTYVYFERIATIENKLIAQADVKKE